VGCGFAVPGLDFAGVGIARGTDSARLLAMSLEAMSSVTVVGISKNCAYSVTWRSVGLTGVPALPPARLVAERGSFDERRR